MIELTGGIKSYFHGISSVATFPQQIVKKSESTSTPYPQRSNFGLTLLAMWYNGRP